MVPGNPDCNNVFLCCLKKQNAGIIVKYDCDYVIAAHIFLSSKYVSHKKFYNDGKNNILI
jgi:hypothetical protein